MVDMSRDCIADFARRPRWLYAKDRLQEGTAVLARLEDESAESELVKARARIITDVRLPSLQIVVEY